MTKKVCLHFYISGKVQGVWFRASTKEIADKLGLTGWTRNLPDGRVEVLACGDDAKIAELHTWLRQGPPLAQVKEVTYEETAWQDHKQFDVK